MPGRDKITRSGAFPVYDRYGNRTGASAVKYSDCGIEVTTGGQVPPHTGKAVSISRNESTNSGGNVALCMAVAISYWESEEHWPVSL